MKPANTTAPKKRKKYKRVPYPNKNTVYPGGKRVTVWLPPDSLRQFYQLENKSRFFQIALSEMVGIMTWHILKERKPEIYYDVEKLENVLDDYNKANPLDPLTQKRHNARALRANPSTDTLPYPELW